MNRLNGSLLLGATEALGEGASFTARNPATGESLPPIFHEASAGQIDCAARLAASAAFDYAALPAARRSAFLRAIASEITALGDELLLRAYSETALPMLRLQSERARTLLQIGAFADLVDEGSWVDARIDRADPSRQPTRKPDLRRMLLPLGPVAVFGASNFPLAFSVAGGDTISALAAGGPVVVKAHPAHPGTSECVARAILRAAQSMQLPDGVFSLLHGPSPEVGLSLVSHPAIQAVGFTGSLGAGRALFDAAMRRPAPIPFYGEMGSQNPLFLLPGALRERGDAIAQGLAQAVTLGVGQFCTNPGLTILLRDEESKRFLARLGSAIAATPAGTMLHSGIKSNYDASRANAASVLGVETLAQAEARGGQPETEAQAALLATDASTFLHSPQLSEEIFGPTTLAVECRDKNELLALARSLPGHLTGTIHGTEADLAEYSELIAILRGKVGRLIWNGFPPGVEVAASMQHGGPYPAATDARSTSVGAAAIVRFARPVCFQDLPESALPPELRADNPRHIWRLVDHQFTKDGL